MRMSEGPLGFSPELLGFLLLGIWHYLPFNKFMQIVVPSTAHVWILVLIMLKLTDDLLEIARIDPVSFTTSILR